MDTPPTQPRLRYIAAEADTKLVQSEWMKGPCPFCKRPRRECYEDECQGIVDATARALEAVALK